MPKLGRRTRKVLLGGGTLAILAAPIAGAAGEGRPLDGGARNPSNDTRQSYTRETEIIANTSTYGTRQSNKSDNGGGAVYGCRSRAGGTARGNEPCLRASNLSDGFAFEFNSNNGESGGLITVGGGGDSKRPFTTNATGVATGLNADRVDGRDASDFLGKSEKAADADKVDGVDGADLARAGDFFFARVDSNGDLVGSRPSNGVSASATSATAATVTFPRNVSNCSFTATQAGTAPSGAALAVAPAGGGAVTVTSSAAPRPAFHLQVMC